MTDDEVFEKCNELAVALTKNGYTVVGKSLWELIVNLKHNPKITWSVNNTRIIKDFKKILSNDNT